RNWWNCSVPNMAPTWSWGWISRRRTGGESMRRRWGRPRTTVGCWGVRKWSSRENAPAVWIRLTPGSGRARRSALWRGGGIETALESVGAQEISQELARAEEARRQSSARGRAGLCVAWGTSIQPEGARVRADDESW